MSRVNWLPDKMKQYGVKVQLVDGWMTRGSDNLSPEVVIVHHDAVPGPASAPGLKIVTNGRADLPGPLCQVYLGRDGTAYMVASGKANHAGKGQWKGFNGNTQALGIEAANDGRGEAWPQVQLEAYYRIVAAMLDGMGKKDPLRVCGHKEWAPGRKIDPNGIDMNNFRQEVAKRLSTPAPVKPGHQMPTIGAFSRGPEVTLWQQLLVNKANQKIKVSGVFDAETVAATKNFQAFAKIKADGIVGPKTWEKMLSI